MVDAQRYSVGELAELGGVSRRTVRYYVHEGLIPTPLGVGRGAHYGPEHLERLLRVKAMQEQGMLLEEIRAALSGRKGRALAAPALPDVDRSRWTRLRVAPGLEIHVSGERRVPPPGKLLELAEWCRRYFRGDEEEDNG
jgi:DNA-binding transcriptional MerR regulator